MAQEAQLEYYTVDAAHMLGIVCKGNKALEWNERALSLAEKATDPTCPCLAGKSLQQSRVDVPRTRTA